MFIFLCVLVSYPLFPLLPQARGEPYRPTSSLSAPVTRFDGRPRARDRPKPRRRPRPKEPEESRRSRSAPATGAPTTPQPPSHTAQNEGPLYRKKATNSDLENQQRSPNRYKAHPPCGREYQSRRTLFLMMRSCQFLFLLKPHACFVFVTVAVILECPFRDQPCDTVFSQVMELVFAIFEIIGCPSGVEPDV